MINALKASGWVGNKLGDNEVVFTHPDFGKDTAIRWEHVPKGKKGRADSDSKWGKGYDNKISLVQDDNIEPLPAAEGQAANANTGLENIRPEDATLVKQLLKKGIDWNDALILLQESGWYVDASVSGVRASNDVVFLKKGHDLSIRLTYGREPNDSSSWYKTNFGVWVDKDTAYGVEEESDGQDTFDQGERLSLEELERMRNEEAGSDPSGTLESTATAVDEDGTYVGAKDGAHGGRAIVSEEDSNSFRIELIRAISKLEGKLTNPIQLLARESDGLLEPIRDVLIKYLKKYFGEEAIARMIENGQLRISAEKGLFSGDKHGDTKIVDPKLYAANKEHKDLTKKDGVLDIMEVSINVWQFIAQDMLWQHRDKAAGSGVNAENVQEIMGLVPKRQLESLIRTFIHETGVHYGLRGMLGGKDFKALLDDVKAKTKTEDSWKDAFLHVGTNYPHLGPDSNPDLFYEEVLANWIGYNYSQDSDFMAKLKELLVRFFRSLGLKSEWITDTEIALLVRSSVASASYRTDADFRRNIEEWIDLDLGDGTKGSGTLESRVEPGKRRPQRYHTAMKGAARSIKNRVKALGQDRDLGQAGPSPFRVAHYMNNDQLAREAAGKKGMEFVAEWDRLNKSRQNLLERGKKELSELANAMHNYANNRKHKFGDILNEVMARSTLIQYNPEKDPAKGSREEVEIHRAYNKMDGTGKRLFQRAANFFESMYDQEVEAFRNSMLQLIPRKEGREQVEEFIKTTFKQKIKPYFPLERFGNYWAKWTDENGEVVIQAFDRLSQRQEFLDGLDNGALQEQPIIYTTLKDDYQQAGSHSPKLVQEALRLIPDDAGKKAFLEAYLKLKHASSGAKHRIQRKGVKGFHEDMLQSIAFNGMESIYRIAHNATIPEQRRVLELSHDSLQKGLKANASKEEKAAYNRKVNIINELRDRIDASQKVEGAFLTESVLGISFLNFLGFAPDSALVNLTQIPLFTIPHLSAEFGWGKSMDAVKRYSKIIRASSKDPTSGFSMYDMLDTEEREAYRILEEAGILNQGLANDITTLSRQGHKYRSTWHRTKILGSYMFSSAEKINREVTAMAAYRLAVDAGLSPGKALQYAQNAVRLTQFDYSRLNKAPFFKKSALRLMLFQFMMYGQGVAYYVARNSAIVIRNQGVSVEERKVAARRVIYTTGASILATGAVHSVVAPVVLSVVAAMQFMFGDDEQEEYREVRQIAFEYLEATFGEGSMTARALYSGLPSLLGINLSNRLGLDPGQHLPSFGGAGLSGELGRIFTDNFAALGVLQNVYDGYTTYRDTGDVAQSLQNAAPRTLQSISKGIRYQTTGATTKTGKRVLDPENISLLSSMIQIPGLSPIGVTDAKHRVRIDDTIVRNAAVDREENIYRELRSLAAAYDAKEIERIELPLDLKAKIYRYNNSQKRLPQELQVYVTNDSITSVIYNHILERRKVLGRRAD